MNKEAKKCLYCQGDNDKNANDCRHCGMTLPQKHPHDKRSKINFFIKAFWVIVVFCVVMMIYLPR